MKNAVWVVLFFSGFILIYSCDKVCKHPVYYDYLPEMNTYFGMYKPGNWWVYKNQDSTETDSIFVSDYTFVNLGPSNVSCGQYPKEDFTLITNHLFGGSSPVTGFFYSSDEWCYNAFSIYNQYNDGFGAEAANDEANPFGVGSTSTVLINNLQLNSFIFENVIYFSRDQTNVFFAPNVGLVRFINYGDTFSISKFFVQ